MQDLHVTLIQSDISWENAPANLEKFGKLIDAVPEPADLIILPEMFNTGFSINPEKCAESMDGPTLTFLKEKAKLKSCIVTGSLLVSENGKYYNRLVVCYPDGSLDHYDKRHLFSLSDEDKMITAGQKKIIVQWKGWKIMPQVCYDLRFPVWSKNRLIDEKFEYDFLYYVANWPETRIRFWNPLLVARAIENQAYVAGVNRIGKDGQGRMHTGESIIIGPDGETLGSSVVGKEQLINSVLSHKRLVELRKKYPFAPDWDEFKIMING
ncbi:MAG: amidohydrolase [Bacteroidota bacterium]